MLASDKPGGVVSNIPMPACIQNQHSSLWDENCRLRAEVRRLEAECQRLRTRESAEDQR